MSTPEDQLQTPFLRPRQDSLNSSRQSPLVTLLGRATGQRAQSMLVRETAARELDERRADWGYSTPIVFLDILWNVAFVVVSFAMLAATTIEKPNTPIRLWICGYALQCLVHACLVWIEYRKRNVRRTRDEERGEARRHESEDDEDSGNHEEGSNLSSSPSQRCESLNTMVSFIWWIIGFYWVISGGDELEELAPSLYWLTVVFLAFDVFFAIFCVALACLIGIALCCCLPCIIAILYAVAGQDGASESDLSALPKYQFQAANKEAKETVGAGKMTPIESTSRVLTTARVLLEEDADCCICLTPYEDGVELIGLPCNHHFHSSCIVKWLKMNATCPLCKFNILKGNDGL